jgi:hypothetical protein
VSARPQLYRVRQQRRRSPQVLMLKSCRKRRWAGPGCWTRSTIGQNGTMRDPLVRCSAVLCRPSVC